MINFAELDGEFLFLARAWTLISPASISSKWVPFWRNNKTLGRTFFRTAFKFLDRALTGASIGSPEPGFSNHFVHGLFEIVETYHSIAVLVCLLEELLPELPVHIFAAVFFVRVEDLLKVLFRNLAIFVGVYDLKGFSDLRVINKSFSV